MARPFPAEPSRGYRTARLSNNPLLRSIGLQILGKIPWFRRDRDNKREEPKLVIKSSLATALARSSVHFLPAMTSVTIIALNLGNLYLGRTIPGPVLDNNITIAILQVLAKMQELLIIASLATIVFANIRDQVLSGDGVPLGFLCSGFMFSQLSYFWSPEFWGGLTSHVSRRSKILTATLLLVAGAIAATAGPSAAILLVPRMQEWDAGGSEFYLEGGPETLYPDVLGASSFPAGSRCIGHDGTQHAFCPSGGFTPLSAYASQLGTIKNGDNIGPLPIMIMSQFGEQSVAVPSTTPGVPATALRGSIRGVTCQTSVIAPFLPIVVYQNLLRDDWTKVIANIPWDPSRLLEQSTAEYRYNYGSFLATSTPVPAVRTACSEAQNISAGVSTMRFPVMPRYSCQGGEHTLSTPLLTREPSDTVRATWIPLPSEFGSVSTGLIFESPWVQNGSSRVVIGCSVDARWADGTVDGFAGGVNTTAPAEFWEHRSEPTYWITRFRPTSDAPDAWRQINLSTSWLTQLTPTLPDVKGNFTTFETMLDRSAFISGILTSSRDATSEWNFQQQGSSNRTLFLEWMTSLLVADGISRHSTERELRLAENKMDWELRNYRLRPDYQRHLLRGGQALFPPPSEKYSPFFMSITINGLSYRAHSVTDYLAIAVLLAHILLALGHSVHLIWRRKSSAAWDSTAEILALAHNSRPSNRALQHTSAGIQCLQTYGKIAVIRAVSSEEGEDGTTSRSRERGRYMDVPPRPELVFTEDDESAVDGNEVSDSDDVNWKRNFPKKKSSGAATWPLSQFHANSHHSRASSGQSLLLASTGERQDGSCGDQVSENTNLGVRRRRQLERVRPDLLYG